jgi:hypothetical protein
MIAQEVVAEAEEEEVEEVKATARQKLRTMMEIVALAMVAEAAEAEVEVVKRVPPSLPGNRV